MTDSTGPPHWLLSLHQTIGQLQAAVTAQTEQMKTNVTSIQGSIQKESEWIVRYVDQRFEDLKTEVFTRFTRTDDAIAKTTQTTESHQLLKGLSTTVLILRHIPWRGLLLVSGAALAFLGHLLPAEIHQALKTLVKS